MTRAQRNFLETVWECSDSEEYLGACAVGAQQRTAKALEHMGLVRYVCHGPILEDTYEDREYPIYEVTDAGRDVVDPNWRKGKRAAPRPSTDKEGEHR